MGWFLGGLDGFLYALIMFVVIDYITGLMAGFLQKKLSSETGFKGICKKVLQEAMSGSKTGDKPSEWAKEATEWAKAQGIVKGFGGDDMGWQAPITREQMAAMLYRFAQLIGKA